MRRWPGLLPCGCTFLSQADPPACRPHHPCPALPASPLAPAGEYLCPICRRLGNCLLPLAPAPQPGGDAAAAPPCLNVQEATQRLEELLAQGEANWAAAPATSSAELLQQAQEQGASPVSLRHRLLVRQYGPQAAAVEQLCLAAQHAGLHWIMEQGRALRWLQKQGTAAGCMRPCVGLAGRVALDCAACWPAQPLMPSAAFPCRPWACSRHARGAAVGHPCHALG